MYRIHPQALSNNRKFEVEILLSNVDGRLKPGFFMHGMIVEPKNENSGDFHSTVLLVPREAVVEQFGASFCYIVSKEGTGSVNDAAQLVAKTHRSGRTTLRRRAAISKRSKWR